MDHAEGDRRINEGKEVVVEKEWQQFWSNSSNSSRNAIDTMSDQMSVYYHVKGQVSSGVKGV